MLRVCAAVAMAPRWQSLPQHATREPERELGEAIISISYILGESAGEKRRAHSPRLYSKNYLLFIVACAANTLGSLAQLYSLTMYRWRVCVCVQKHCNLSPFTRLTKTKKPAGASDIRFSFTRRAFVRSDVSFRAVHAPNVFLLCAIFIYSFSYTTTPLDGLLKNQHGIAWPPPSPLYEQMAAARPPHGTILQVYLFRVEHWCFDAWHLFGAVRARKTPAPNKIYLFCFQIFHLCSYDVIWSGTFEPRSHHARQLFVCLCIAHTHTHAPGLSA